MTSDKWIEIGTIVAPQGLDGSVRVYPSTDFPERFLEPGQRWLRRSESEEPQPIELIEGRYVPAKGLFVVLFAGVEDRDEAEALRGGVLLVPESDRPILEEGEYHVRDLIGLPVFNQLTGELAGTVADIVTAGNDLLQVQLKESPAEIVPENQAAVESKETLHPHTRRGGRKRKKSQQKPAAPKTVLIPFVEEIVPVVDLQAGRIEIVPPAGLLESS